MLKLRNGYYIDADRYGFTLRQKKKYEKDGELKDRDVMIGSHSSLCAAINNYVRIRMASRIEKEDLELKDVKAALAQIHEEINEIGV